jgi:hypothetical protein
VQPASAHDEDVAVRVRDDARGGRAHEEALDAVVPAVTDDDQVELAALGLVDDGLGGMADGLELRRLDTGLLELGQGFVQLTAVLFHVAADDGAGTARARRLERHDADDGHLGVAPLRDLGSTRECMPRGLRTVVCDQDLHRASSSWTARL